MNNVTLAQFKAGLKRQGDILRKHGLADPAERKVNKYRNVKGKRGGFTTIETVIPDET